MKKEYLISIPSNITTTDIGINFYDKINVVSFMANNLKEIYDQFPNALKAPLKIQQASVI